CARIYYGSYFDYW
nr:immunoglobulin heavy chain junction region [Mus musculus]MBK4198309.1 immunoglobulin heavy chain junction region [Mus musculus]MBK4198311.1 immunoglobulin heavy chain junction region [Mus musculus]